MKKKTYLLDFVLAQSGDEVGNKERDVATKVEQFVSYKGPPRDEVLFTHMIQEYAPGILEHCTARHETSRGRTNRPLSQTHNEERQCMPPSPHNSP